MEDVTHRVVLTCTDRGQHRRMKLGEARLLADGRAVVLSFERKQARVIEYGRPILAPGTVPLGGGAIVCPKCGRHPRFGKRLPGELAQLRDAGVSELDMSRLPL